MPAVLRLAHAVMALLFFLSALLQFNDPNPLPWILIYLLAAGASGLCALLKLFCAQIVGGLVLLVGLISEIPYIRVAAWQTPWTDLTREWKMTSESVVDGREFYALLWIIGWMVVVVVTARLAQRKTSS